MNLNTTTVITEDWVELILEGTIDVNTAEGVLKDVQIALRSGVAEVRLDLSRVEYISSAGIRAMLMIQKEAHKEEGVSVSVVRASDFVTSVVRMAGLQDLFAVIETNDVPPAQSLRCTIKPHPMWTDLNLSGSLNVFSVKWLVEKVREMIKGGTRHLRLNAEGITYLSSAGVRSLLMIYKEMAAERGSFRIVQPSEELSNVLRMAGIDSLLITE